MNWCPKVPALDDLKELAYEAADSGLLSSHLAAGIRRVKGVRNLGVHVGNWLTVESFRDESFRDS